ncbi:thioredoxin family protein [Alkalitalea saponilacus]|nr:thioredoxin family protein [Alkalitalea saponilacus]ASB49239.1 thioredoxin family protein [Alkalitalea saponilacus]
MAADIKVLGPGCAKCKTLEKATQEAVEELQLNATVSKVEDIMEIMSYNVVSTPAVVVDGKVVVKGRVPSKDELKKLIGDAANA